MYKSLAFEYGWMNTVENDSGEGRFHPNGESPTMIQTINHRTAPWWGLQSASCHPLFQHPLIRGSSNHLRTLHVHLIDLFTLVLSKIVTGHQMGVIHFRILTDDRIDRPRGGPVIIRESENDLCSPTTLVWCSMAVHRRFMVSWYSRAANVFKGFLSYGATPAGCRPWPESIRWRSNIWCNAETLHRGHTADVNKINVRVQRREYGRSYP